MGRIKVNSDVLRSYAGTLNGRISEYEALAARMAALNDNIQASWQGDAKIAFSNMMATYLQQISQLQQILVQFRDYAQTAADRFESVDTECAQRIRSSF